MPRRSKRSVCPSEDVYNRRGHQLLPLAYVVDGNYWGFDVQLAMAVCERLGWTLQIQPIEKENVYVELSSGNIDCAWGGIALDQKEVEAGKYTQYGPYVSNNIVVAGRNGSIVWNKLKLGGRTMAMCSTEESMAALETDRMLAKRLGQIIRLAGGTLECFEYLYSGKCVLCLRTARRSITIIAIKH